MPLAPRENLTGGLALSGQTYCEIIDGYVVQPGTHVEAFPPSAS